jgi:PAS domain S-box-containing protein
LPPRIGMRPLTAHRNTFAPTDFLRSNSEVATLIRAHDWAITPVGPIDQWPHILKMTTTLLLQSPIAIVTLWGPEGVMIYNDAYSRFSGSRHPGLLGRNVRDAWPEVADFNDHVLKTVLHGGQNLSYKDQELSLNRDGVFRQLWADLDYSPVFDESGRSVGVFVVVTETTERVLADRRIAAERERQQQLFGQMPGFVGVLSGPEHVYEYVNEAYLAISDRANFIGKTVPTAASPAFLSAAVK